MKRILYIAHFFPPIGGAGVQRSLKFVKYLPQFGFLPTVLTGSGGSTGRWSPTDKSLLDEVPQEVRIMRIADPDKNAPGSSSQRITALLTAGEQALREQEHELIFVSMSPFGDARIASELSRRTGVPWVADLRDPWALDEFQVYRSILHRIRERWRMKKALESASLIIMNTPESARRFSQAFPGMRSRVTAITNGYDADDFSAPVESAPSGRFTVVHTGYFHTTAGFHQRRRALQYRLLGRVQHGVEFLPRSHFYLIKALERWRATDAGMAERVRVRCAGAMTDSDRQLAAQSSVADLFEFAEYLPHNESISALGSASLLFLPMHKLPLGQRATIVPGKTYEYMASQKPILAAVPEGDARDFVARAGTGLVCEPDDAGRMAETLKDQFNSWARGRTTARWNREYVEQFERRELTKRLAAELRRLSAPAGSRSMAPAA